MTNQQEIFGIWLEHSQHTAESTLELHLEKWSLTKNIRNEQVQYWERCAEELREGEEGVEATIEWVRSKKIEETWENLRELSLPLEGVVVEVGAGSCWLSGMLSKMRSVRRVYAIETSAKILRNRAMPFLTLLKADTSKIKLIQGDAHNLLLPPRSIDVICFDASMCHIDNLSRALSECRRVLKDNGVLISLREPIQQIFRSKSMVPELNLVQTRLSKKGWTNLFQKSGFHAHAYFDAHSVGPIQRKLMKTMCKIALLQLIFSLLFPPKYIFIVKKDLDRKDIR